MGDLLDNIGTKPRHESVRIGVKNEGAVDRARPIKVSLASR